MLTIVKEYMDDANYFTIEFQRKFSDYDIRLKNDDNASGKTTSWKQFFVETYSD